ncbi:hypothetical protein DdX_22215 [Ditylenchus destructor]|uniref:Uncharacterized protein n=1 Tax=Ditylenchus destructor TaxID=166010 RepID=A0AAD4QSM6_9BILA|nr:hypothetical protein DdX_22215 [Ditylenchus destructor]
MGTIRWCVRPNCSLIERNRLTAFLLNIVHYFPGNLFLENHVCPSKRQKDAQAGRCAAERADRVVPSHRSSSFESSGKEGAHTTSQSMSEGRTKEEERDAYDPARAPTQLADTHASLSLLLSCVPRSLIGWSCAPLLFHLTRNSNYGDSEQP